MTQIRIQIHTSMWELIHTHTFLDLAGPEEGVFTSTEEVMNIGLNGH